LQRPDLNRLQKTITTACDKERFVRPQERALISTHAKQILNVRTQESSKTERILLAKNIREKNPQLPVKQGESCDVRHLPPAYARTYHFTSKSPSKAVFIRGSSSTKQEPRFQMPRFPSSLTKLSKLNGVLLKTLREKVEQSKRRLGGRSFVAGTAC
jgi:hypothetical protein